MDEICPIPAGSAADRAFFFMSEARVRDIIYPCEALLC